MCHLAELSAFGAPSGWTKGRVLGCLGSAFKYCVPGVKLSHLILGYAFVSAADALGGFFLQRSTAVAANVHTIKAFAVRKDKSDGLHLFF